MYQIKVYLAAAGTLTFTSDDTFDKFEGPAGAEETLRFLRENYPDLGFELVS